MSVPVINSFVSGMIERMRETISKIPPVKRYITNKMFCAAVWDLNKNESM